MDNYKIFKPLRTAHKNLVETLRTRGVRLISRNLGKPPRRRPSLVAGARVLAVGLAFFCWDFGVKHGHIRSPGGAGRAGDADSCRAGYAGPGAGGHRELEGDRDARARGGVPVSHRSSAGAEPGRFGHDAALRQGGGPHAEAPAPRPAHPHRGHPGRPHRLRHRGTAGPSGRPRRPRHLARCRPRRSRPRAPPCSTPGSRPPLRTMASRSVTTPARHQATSSRSATTAP